MAQIFRPNTRREAICSLLLAASLFALLVAARKHKQLDTAAAAAASTATDDDDDDDAEKRPSNRRPHEERRLIFMKAEIDYSLDSRRVDSKVYDQGACNTSWAYTITGQLEGQELRAGLLKDHDDEIRTKSKAQLINCNPNGNDFDVGAIADYLNVNQIEYERAVPRSGQCKGKCEKRDECATYKMENLALAKSNSGFINGEQGFLLERVLKEYGPVAWFTNDWAPQWDSRGVVDLPCLNRKFNNTNSSVCHSILLVGFGRTLDGTGYFKFKNSRGSRWGQRGYGFILRNQARDCPYRLFGSFYLFRLKPCDSV